MKRYRSLFLAVLAFLITFSSIACFVNVKHERNDLENVEETVENNNKNEEVKPVSKSTPYEGNIYDNKMLYENDNETSVITMYLTVSSGNEADGTNHTWEEINTYSTYDYRDMGIDRYKVEGLLKIDETGEGLTEESYGYDEIAPNVSVQVRGQTSSKGDNKNYKIRIKDGKDEFRGQRTLNLNKHKYDPYRFLNKMSYDLLKSVPELMAGRTQFVHLYVKDTTGDSQGEYIDYGLYTMVEQVNKTYLKNHNLEENGQLYKVTFFEWDEYEAVMMDPDDPEFDRAAFERYIEIKGDEDPAKIQDIVKEIHNYNIPIEDIIDRHFDEENLCYWLAFNILIGNNDVGARNLFLYSPLNSEKFYFICWDMDASFKYNYNKMTNRHDGDSWETGMTKFLGLTLVRRMMKEEKYRKMLDDAVEDIYANYVNPEIVAKKAEAYKSVTIPFLYGEGEGGRDEQERLHTLEEYENLIDLLPSEVDTQYQIYKESMKKPWPFFVEVPFINNDNQMVMSWEVSYDINSEPVTYDYILARDYLFEDVVYEGNDLTVPIVSVDFPGAGTYFLRVRATNESGYTMDCFDYFPVSGYGKQYACYSFVIDENGMAKANAGE